MERKLSQAWWHPLHPSLLHLLWTSFGTHFSFEHHRNPEVVVKRLSQVWSHLLHPSLLHLIWISFEHTFHLIIMETLRHVSSLSPLREENKTPSGNHGSLLGSEYSQTTYNMAFNHLLLVTELRNFSGIIQPAFTERDYVPDTASHWGYMNATQNLPLKHLLQID